MIKALKVVGLVVLIVIAAYSVYILRYTFNPYLANGAVDAEKVAVKAAEKNDLNACDEITTYPFPLFIEGFDITKKDLKALCYYKLAELKQDKTICAQVVQYTNAHSIYKTSCELNVDIKSRQTPVSTRTALSTNNTSNKISDWKTYTNNEYGFEIKYPSHWSYRITPQSSGVGSTTQFTDSKGGYILSINNPIREIGYESHELLKTEQRRIEGSNKYFTIKTYGPTSKNIPNNLVIASWNTDNWKNSGEIVLAYASESEIITIFDQMLSTLRLKGPVISNPPTGQSTGWKTYASLQRGFEFKYPGSWSFEENSIFDKASSKKLTVRYIPKEQNSAPAPTYCMAFPTNPRCKIIKIDDNHFANIDWGADGNANATIGSRDGGRIELYIAHLTATDKEVVLQILSTFIFTK